MTDIETESLPAHVSICQQRYLNLETRLNALENRIEKIEGLVLDIHQKIDQATRHNSHRWEKAQIALIGCLIGVIGWLVGRLAA